MISFRKFVSMSNKELASYFIRCGLKSKINTVPQVGYNWKAACRLLNLDPRSFCFPAYIDGPVKRVVVKKLHHHRCSTIMMSCCNSFDDVSSIKIELISKLGIDIGTILYLPFRNMVKIYRYSSMSKSQMVNSMKDLKLFYGSDQSGD